MVERNEKNNLHLIYLVKIVMEQEVSPKGNLPWHGYMVEGEVIEKRLAGDCSKLRGEVHQLSL